jgi:hypothetical protein
MNMAPFAKRAGLAADVTLHQLPLMRHSTENQCRQRPTSSRMCFGKTPFSSLTLTCSKIAQAFQVHRSRFLSKLRTAMSLIASPAVSLSLTSPAEMYTPSAKPESMRCSSKGPTCSTNRNLGGRRVMPSIWNVIPRRSIYTRAKAGARLALGREIWQAGPLPASGGLYAQAALTTPTTSLGYRADGLLLSRLHMIAVEVAYRGTSRGTQFKSAIERPLSSARNKLPGVETNSSQTLKRRVSLLDSVWLERLRVGDNTVRLLSQAEEVVHLEHW